MIKKLIPTLIIYIFIGWGVLIIQNPGLFSATTVILKPKHIKPEAEPPREFVTFDHFDKIIGEHIAAGRNREAIMVLLDVLKKDAVHDDNSIIKKSGFKTHANTIRQRRYLSNIDALSLIFRLGQRLNMPESEIAAMLFPYMERKDDPESVQEYVVALQYRLSYGHYDDIEGLFSDFKKYLHTNFGVEKDIIRERPFLYYYPYLRGSYLSLTGRYQEAGQYLVLALMFRPDYSGESSADLAQIYLKLDQNENRKALFDSLPALAGDTAQNMFFKSSYNE